jgi:predicted secreted protein
MTALAGEMARRRVVPTDEASTVLSRVFGGQNLGDAADCIRIDLPRMVAEDTPATLEVEVGGRAVLHAPAARLYVIADENRVPLLAQVELRPDGSSPRVSLEIRLDASTHLRVVLALDDGTLLQAARWVWVLPRDSAPALEAPRR